MSSKPTSWQEESPHKIHLGESKFYQMLMYDVFGPRSGGAIIIIDAENARKGIGKTSAQVGFARKLASDFGYELQYEDFTMTFREYLERATEHPGSEQPSVICPDELVGSGMGNKMRANSKTNVKLGTVWQLMRKKRIVSIGTTPDWNDLAPRLRKLADYRLWCREKPIGSFQPYKVTVPFDSESGHPRPKSVSFTDSSRRIFFPNVDKNDCLYYQYIDKKKDAVIDAGSWDAEGALDSEETDEEQLSEKEITRQLAIEQAIRAYQPWVKDQSKRNEHDLPSQQQVADEMFGDYSQQFVAKHNKRWRNGDHRDKVKKPPDDVIP